MKFKSKPVKVEQDCTSGSELDIAEAMRSLSPLPRSSIHPQDQQQQQQPPVSAVASAVASAVVTAVGPIMSQHQDDSDMEQNPVNTGLTKLPSPSPISKFFQDYNTNVKK